MLGMTWQRTLDGALDLGEFIRNHPEHENDPLLVSARIALL